MMKKQIRLITLLVFLLTLSFTCRGICQEEEQEKENIFRDLSFNKKTNTISYELSIPAWVRIRIGVPDGPLYSTICDWEKREAGKHEERWDEMDPTGTLKLTGRDDLVSTFNYFTEGDEFLSDVKTFIFQAPAGNISGRHLPDLKLNRMHKENHPREFCHEVKVRIKPLKRIPRTKDGFYIIKNKTPIEISIDDEDMPWFTAERYSIHVFIDDIFAQGELDGYSPYTWIFDPKDLNEGRHSIMVNLAGFNDHYGIAGLPVYIKRGGRKDALGKK